MLLDSLLRLGNPWVHYVGLPTGTRVDGDRSVRPTTRWNHRYMLWRGWKHAVRFRVPPERAREGYQVGFVTEEGIPQISRDVLYDEVFRVKIGYESCNFFAISAKTRDEFRITPLSPLHRDIRHPEDRHIPLV